MEIFQKMEWKVYHTKNMWKAGGPEGNNENGSTRFRFKWEDQSLCPVKLLYVGLEEIYEVRQRY
jgi:hypothetical protein